MPVMNPTNNPFQQTIHMPKDVEQLRKLQVKVNLRQIGEAPRSFGLRLKHAENPENMVVDSSTRGHMKICDRFGRIQHAQRAMAPLTIKLLNE